MYRLQGLLDRIEGQGLKVYHEGKARLLRIPTESDHRFRRKVDHPFRTNLDQSFRRKLDH